MGRVRMERYVRYELLTHERMMAHHGHAWLVPVIVVPAPVAAWAGAETRMRVAVWTAVRLQGHFCAICVSACILPMCTPIPSIPVV